MKTKIKVLIGIMLLSGIMLIVVASLVYGAWVGMSTNDGLAIFQCRKNLEHLEEARKHGNEVLVDYLETNLNVNINTYSYYVETRKYAFEKICFLWSQRYSNKEKSQEILEKLISYRKQYPSKDKFADENLRRIVITIGTIKQKEEINAIVKE